MILYHLSKSVDEPCFVLMVDLLQQLWTKVGDAKKIGFQNTKAKTSLVFQLPQPLPGVQQRTGDSRVLSDFS